MFRVCIYSLDYKINCYDKVRYNEVSWLQIALQAVWIFSLESNVSLSHKQTFKALEYGTNSINSF